MGVSTERKKEHRKSLVGEGTTYLPDSMDYDEENKKRIKIKGQRSLV